MFLSPKRRIAREVASDTLFPDLPPRAATNAMYNALSAARAALADVGGPATGVLRTDRTHIYIPDDVPVVVDLEVHERALSAALGMAPGEGRDAALVEVLSEERVLLGRRGLRRLGAPATRKPRAGPPGGPPGPGPGPFLGLGQSGVRMSSRRGKAMPPTTLPPRRPLSP